MNLIRIRLKSTLLLCIAVSLLAMILLSFFKETEYVISEIDEEIEVGKTKIQTRYPAIVWWTGPSRAYAEEKLCPNQHKCHFFPQKHRHRPMNVSAYLFYASTINFNQLPLPRHRKHIWGLVHEESPRNVQELMHEKALNLFNFSSTFSRYSDVPFPLFDLRSISDITSKKFYVNTKEKNSLSNVLSPVLFMNSDCSTATERETYVKELMKYISVDSYGDCLNNKELPQVFKVDYVNKLYDDDILQFISRYKFMIAIENGVCNDYVTEKFWRPIKVGVVPIYFGSPSIRDWLPNNKSAILLEDYPTPELLAAYLNKLLKDDNLYEQHLEHKTKGIITNKRIEEELKLRPYQRKFLPTMEEFECFICGEIHGNIEKHVVNKSHYDCPVPISALTLTVNRANSWVSSLFMSESKVENLYNSIAEGAL